MTTLSERDLVAHIRAELEHEPDARVFAFRTMDDSWMPGEVPVNGERFRVVRAQSELAIREALVRREGDERLAILTALDDRDLGLDVLARLARRRLLRLDPWETVRSAFGAQSVEPRLRSLPLLGRALLKAAPPGGYRPVPTGTLDAETAWSAYERHGLGLETSDGLESLFEWLLTDLRHAQRLLDEPVELRTHLVRRWMQRGLNAETWLRAIAHAQAFGEPEDPIVVGLALAAARRAKNDGLHEADRFVIRLEEFFGNGKPPSAPQLERFGAAAEGALVRAWDQLEATTRGRLEQRLDALLGDKAAPELHAFANIGNQSRAAALRELAQAIVDVLDDNADTSTALRAHERFIARADVDEGDEISRHATDLVRLAVRHRTVSARPTSAADAGRELVQTWSFEDALRERISAWDGGAELRAATLRVVDEWLEISEVRNAAFAPLVADALEEPGKTDEVLWVWDVIADVVAPISSERNVLVIVLDALNWAVARSLLAAPSSWDAWVPAREGRIRPVFTAVPSVTEFSRASLLCGTPTAGNANDESKQFPLAVERAAGRECKAKLVHKGVLDGEGRGRVADEVVRAVEDDRLRVVGVVVNAIDDQLSGADQLRVHWNASDVAPLRTLLDLAGATERVVVLVGDHGHVWETRSERAAGGRSARWRDGTDAGDGEVTIGGPLVKKWVGVDSIVAAWSEQIRYGKGRRGYHGGASLQEVVVPCIVLDESELELDETAFVRFATSPPGWWRFEAEPVLDDAPTPAGQGDLLDIVEGGWIDQLLGSAAFADRRRRFVAGDGQFVDIARTVLRLLEAGRGRVSIQAISRQLGRNVGVTMRYVSTLGDVLNIDGTPLLSLDRIDGMVNLDDVGLRRQFTVTVDWSV